MSTEETEAIRLCANAETEIFQEEDSEAGCESARAALAIYRKLGNFQGVASSTRLLVQAYLLEVEQIRFEAHFGSQKVVRDVLKKAEGICLKELDHFRENDNEYGKASMLLALAELSVAGRGEEKRQLALDRASQALNMFKELQDQRMEAHTLMTLSAVHLREARVDEAVACARDAVAACRKGDDLVLLVKALRCLAEAHWLNQDSSVAVDVLMEALKSCRMAGDRRLEVSLLEKIGSWQMVRERPREALPPAREALTILEEIDTLRRWNGNAIQIVVEAYLAVGDMDAAMREAKDGLTRFKESKNWRMETAMLCLLAKVHFARAEIQDALKQGDLAYSAVGELYDPELTSNVLQTCFEVFYGIGYYEHALYCQEEVAKLKADQNDVVGEVKALCSQGQVLEHLVTKAERRKPIAKRLKSLDSSIKSLPRDSSTGDIILRLAKVSTDVESEGLELAHEALGVFQLANDPSKQAEAWAVIAEMNLKLQRQDKALQAAIKCRKLWQNCDRAMKAADSYQLEAEVQLVMKDFTGSMKSAWQGQVACKTAEHGRGEVKALILIMKAAVGKMEQENMSLEKKNLDKVLRAAKDARRVALKFQDISLPHAIYWHGKVTNASGDHEEALELVFEALPLYKELKDIAGEASAQLLLASCYDALQRKTEAVEAAEKALKLFSEADIEAGVANAFALLRKFGAISSGPAMPVQMSAPIPTEPAPAPAITSDAIATQSARPSKEAIKLKIGKGLKDLVADDDQDITDDTPLMEAGLDSLAAVSFRNELATNFEVALPASLIFDYPNVNGIADYIHGLID